MIHEARCFSIKCSPKPTNVFSYSVKYHMTHPHPTCPDCGGAVHWGPPGRRRRDQVLKPRIFSQKQLDALSVNHVDKK